MQPDILVTGAAGFIGSAIVDRLLAVSKSVRASDLALHSPTVLTEYVSADILNPAAAALTARDVRTVVHAAGLAHVKRLSPEVVKAFFDVNVTATENLAKAAVAAGAEHFVLVSSVSIYGNHGSTPCDESTPCHPLGPYAESKLQAEQAVLRSAERSKMRVTILRLATAFGEGDRGNVAKLMRTIDAGRFVWIGRGENMKTLIFRDDVASACEAVIADGGDPVQIYNVAMPPCTMREIVATLASELNRPLPTWHLPPQLVQWGTDAAAWLAGNRGRLGAIQSSLQKWLDDDIFDGKKLQRVLGFRPLTSLQEGIRREVAWYRGLSQSGKTS